MLLPQIVFADWSGSVIETYPLGEQLSKEQACKNAVEKAKLTAMSNAGLESITFKQFESCAASENKTEAFMHKVQPCFLPQHQPDPKDTQYTRY